MVGERVTNRACEPLAAREPRRADAIVAQHVNAGSEPLDVERAVVARVRDRHACGITPDQIHARVAARIDRGHVRIGIGRGGELLHGEPARPQTELRRRVERALVRHRREATIAMQREPGASGQLVDTADEAGT